MTTEVRRILNQCKALGIIVEASPDGQYLDLHYQEPPPEELRQLLKAHKSDILAVLRPQPPIWHAQKIAEAVKVEGCCLFWSEVVREVVAFVLSDTFRPKVPTGIVAYTLQEIEQLWREGKPKVSPRTLRMIHQAKKAGARVTNVE